MYCIMHCTYIKNTKYINGFLKNKQRKDKTYSLHIKANNIIAIIRNYIQCNCHCTITAFGVVVTHQVNFKAVGSGLSLVRVCCPTPSSGAIRFSHQCVGVSIIDYVIMLTVVQRVVQLLTCNQIDNTLFIVYLFISVSDNILSVYKTYLHHMHNKCCWAAFDL